MTGVLGAYAYMGPKAGRDVFVLKPETADLTFGVITVLTGILGTVRSCICTCMCRWFVIAPRSLAFLEYVCDHVHLLVLMTNFRTHSGTIHRSCAYCAANQRVQTLYLHIWDIMQAAGRRQFSAAVICIAVCTSPFRGSPLVSGCQHGLPQTCIVLLQVGGGVVLDRIGSSVPNALLLCAGAVGAGGLFCALSFAAAGSLASFAPLFALGELGLFAIQARVRLGTAAAKVHMHALLRSCKQVLLLQAAVVSFCH
jgi:hypothetical protein